MYTQKGRYFNNKYHREGPFALDDEVLRNNIKEAGQTGNCVFHCVCVGSNPIHDTYFYFAY